MEFVNLTPHPINIKKGDELITIPPSGIVARVKTERVLHATFNDIPIYHQTFSDIDGLPPPTDNVLYIVSAVVLQAVKDSRDDVVSPDTLNAIRDQQGNIIGVTGFVR